MKYGAVRKFSHYFLHCTCSLFNNRYTDNQRAQDAINVTFFHWGIHGWLVYVVVGLLLAFLCYRRGLPMTMRSCLYPLLGEKIYGWMGDFVDVLSVVCTMFGVCTSLGLGAIQLNAGFRRLNREIKFNTTNQIIAIWVVTACATASVISGLKLGIRRLSELCFCIGLMLMLVVLFYDNTWYLLNVVLQSIGYYLQNIIQIGFHTDAYAQLRNAPDNQEAAEWMNDWTIFYWGWWIARCPFVGMFIAKISRGRTIKQFINATLTAPIVFTFLWFAIFGGAGLRMEREAANVNITCSSLLGGETATESLNGLYRLSCRSKNDMWFDLMGRYGDLGGFLSVVSVIDIILYFVASSESGSLVIDCLSANGDPHPPVIQRIFWSLTEGATATALLYAGGTDALKALQAVAIAAGLPYTILVCFMCVALWRALQTETGDLNPNGPRFSVGLMNVLCRPSYRSSLRLVIAVLAPWYVIAVAMDKHHSSSKRKAFAMLFMAVPFNAWIVLLLLELVPVEGISYVGWAVLFVFFGIATAIRTGIREAQGINGNMVEDFFVVMLLYPLAAHQMEQQEWKEQDDPNNNRDIERNAHTYENSAYSGIYENKSVTTQF